MYRTVIHDLRYGLRTLGRAPGFTAAAAATLALGIAATTVLFTVVNGVLLRPLPYADPDRLVLLHAAYPQRGMDRGAMSLPDVRDWSERTQAVTRMGAYTTLPSALVPRASGFPIPRSRRGRCSRTSRSRSAKVAASGGARSSAHVGRSSPRRSRSRSCSSSARACCSAASGRCTRLIRDSSPTVRWASR